jgi:uncharacterized protein YcbK (DUF882 family)
VLAAAVSHSQAGFTKKYWLVQALLPKIKNCLFLAIAPQACMMNLAPDTSRRTFLHNTAKLAALGGLLAVGSGSALASVKNVKNSRSLAFEHLHTNEHLSLVYAVGDSLLPRALGRLDLFLRDHYSGDVGSMDPQLFDLLYRLRMALGTREPFQIISGYRSPNTNGRLRQTGGGGVAKKSLHMEGKAIDLRLPGVALVDLRDAALSLQAGGVGFYPNDNFVHVDTGAVRSWGG